MSGSIGFSRCQKLEKPSCLRSRVQPPCGASLPTPITSPTPTPTPPHPGPAPRHPHAFHLPLSSPAHCSRPIVSSR
ncbi:hypothetical protein FLX56_05895 [Synechococcus moorigangaii CMS01]|nr:hypothetical protein [Synechococcus moorigangaii CMS01]